MFSTCVINLSFFYRKFAPRCCVCQQPIMPEPGQDETIRVVALDRSFHINCYKCEVIVQFLSVPITIIKITYFRTADCCYRLKQKDVDAIHLTITFYARTATQSEFKNSQASFKPSYSCINYDPSGSTFKLFKDSAFLIFSEIRFSVIIFLNLLISHKAK